MIPTARPSSTLSASSADRAAATTRPGGLGPSSKWWTSKVNLHSHLNLQVPIDHVGSICFQNLIVFSAVEFDIQAATEINTTSRSAVTPDVTSAGELYNEQSSDEVGQESDDSWVDLECDGSEFGCDNLDGEDDSESGGEPNSEEDHSTDGSSYFLPSATEKED